MTKQNDIRKDRQKWNAFWTDHLAYCMYGRPYHKLTRSERIQVQDAGKEMNE